MLHCLLGFHKALGGSFSSNFAKDLSCVFCGWYEHTDCCFFPVLNNVKGRLIKHPLGLRAGPIPCFPPFPPLKWERHVRQLTSSSEKAGKHTDTDKRLTGFCKHRVQREAREKPATSHWNTHPANQLRAHSHLTVEEQRLLSGSSRKSLLRRQNSD